MATRISTRVKYDGERFLDSEDFTFDVDERGAIRLGQGMLFEADWTLDGNEDYSIWWDGKCIIAHGDYAEFIGMDEADCDFASVEESE